MAIATRMAFICKENELYFNYYTFEFFGGFAISQKRKSIESFHNKIRESGIEKVLEVSRKNENEIGVQLSAFNLMANIDEASYPVECIYQSSKVFGNKQYKECLKMYPGDAKRYVKEKVEEQNLLLTHFSFKNNVFPLEPKSIFYDYLYIYALNQNKVLGEQILKYDCFTDIEFNHKKQFASQARSCAIFKYLYLNKKIDDFLLNPLAYEYLYKNLQEYILF